MFIRCSENPIKVLEACDWLTNFWVLVRLTLNTAIPDNLIYLKQGTHWAIDADGKLRKIRTEKAKPPITLVDQCTLYRRYVKGDKVRYEAVPIVSAKSQMALPEIMEMANKFQGIVNAKEMLEFIMLQNNLTLMSLQVLEGYDVAIQRHLEVLDKMSKTLDKMDKAVDKIEKKL